MADDWEAEHGLDPADGDDHATAMPSGYTAIEEYVNELAVELTGVQPTAAPATNAPPATDSSDSDDDGEGEAADTPVAQTAADSDDGGSDGLAVVALVISVVALVVAGASLYLARRPRPAHEARAPGPDPP